MFLIFHDAAREGQSNPTRTLRVLELCDSELARLTVEIMSHDLELYS
jgi:hypothetical protein